MTKLAEAIANTVKAGQ
ncbi:beta-class phenol-soluble modulin, partial [Staphylococcus capitis]